MRERDVDHLLVTNPKDVAYLTGFLGGDSFLFIGPRGKPLILSDRRYEEELAGFSDVAKLVLRDGPMAPLIARLTAERHDAGALERLGVQAEDLTLAQLDGMKSAFKKAKVAVRTLTPVENMLGPLRRVKDEQEIRTIQRAAKLQQEAMKAVLPEAKPGISELELCAMLEAEMKARGSSEPAFETIVGAQANGSKSHYAPRHTRLRKGKPLLIDWGATVDGYRSDMTRTFSLGTWPKELAAVYDIVLEAHEAGAAALRAGVLCADVDAAARDVIDRAGYGEKFGHSLGHGIGLNVHERPTLSRHAGEATVEEGHVVTIEPGVYLPGVGGVRIEDDYLVTRRGSKNLCSLPKDRAWATL